jgi:hypothetical protein
MAEAELLIARLVKPFLDDAIQPMPPGFFGYLTPKGD